MTSEHAPDLDDRLTWREYFIDSFWNKPVNLFFATFCFLFVLLSGLGLWLLFGLASAFGADFLAFEIFLGAVSGGIALVLVLPRYFWMQIRIGRRKPQRVDQLVSRAIECFIKSLYKDDELLGSNLWMSVSPPGQFLPESQYGNPWSSTNPNGLYTATENLAYLVNKLPKLTRSYQVSTSNVEDQYELVLKLAAPQRQAVTPAASVPDIYSIALEESVSRSLVEVAAPNGALVKLAQMPQVTSNPPATTSTADASESINRVLLAAKELFEATALPSQINPGMTYHSVEFAPGNWVSVAAARNWPQVRIALPDADGRAVLEMRHTRVEITRPWLVTSLLSLPGWKMQGVPRGALSSGSGGVNTGSFPLLPVRLVVGFDLRVTRPDGSVLWQSPDIQILGWISNVLPELPPS